MAEKAARIAKCTRTTNETDITLEFNIDGKGQSKIDTGIGFFDHMLTSFAKHGFFDLNVTVKGDLYVDCHHTIEDVGIVLGKAIKEALCFFVCGIGSFFVPRSDFSPSPLYELSPYRRGGCLSLIHILTALR